MAGSVKMKKDKIMYVSVVFLLVAACTTTSPSPPPAPQEADSRSPIQTPVEPTPEEVRSAYNRGYEMILETLADSNQDTTYESLYNLKSFKEKWVRWAELRGNAYYPLEDGYRGTAWLVVVPPGNDYLAKMEATLQVYATESLVVLNIKPERVTSQWAGIFLFHELSHLMDRLYQIEPLNPSREQFLQGELRAYQAELLAANLQSDGNLDRQMDVLISKLHPSSLGDLVQKCRLMDLSEYALLDSALGNIRPESEAEVSIRLGFYLLSISIRYAQLNDSREIPSIIDYLYFNNASE
jgi:hypothetical protein